MDISLGKRRANWHSQEVAQVLHGLLESVWWGIFGTLQPLRKRGRVGPGPPPKDCSTWGFSQLVLNTSA